MNRQGKDTSEGERTAWQVEGVEMEDNRVMAAVGIAALVDKRDNNRAALEVWEVVDRQQAEAVQQVGLQGGLPAMMAVLLLLEGLVQDPVPGGVAVEVLKEPVFDPANLSSFADDWFSPLHPLLSQPKSDWDILSLPNRFRGIFDYI